MTRTHCRLLAILLLAAAVDPLRAQLRESAPAVFGRSGLALAQPFSDPGFGDPLHLSGSDMPSGLPPVGYPTNPYLPNSYGPRPPNQPSAPIRPPGWPGGNPRPAGVAANGHRVATALPSTRLPFKKSPADPPYDPAEILAHVGSERIQACEVLPMINRVIFRAVQEDERFAKLSEEARQREIHNAQRAYMQVALKEMIGTKLLVAELRAAADKGALEDNQKKIRDFFNNTYLKHLQADYKACSIPDLDDKLRQLGGSIESQRTLFIEQHLASGWLDQAVQHEDKEPTHDEMLAYYRGHQKDWETPARTRWEQLSAKFVNFNSREEATATLARWGNDILVRRVPFAAVAKAHSQDYAADDGGVHDWASRGSLRSTVLEEALFSLPVNALSQILQDDEGCHIVRVLAREEARQAPFTEVQPEIRKQLHDGGEEQRQADYIETLRKRTPVWTVFDEDEDPTAAAAAAGAPLAR